MPRKPDIFGSAGELPFEDEAGQRVEWIDGQLHAGHNQLLWREVHSEEHGRPYYYNVETGQFWGKQCNPGCPVATLRLLLSTNNTQHARMTTVPA